MKRFKEHKKPVRRLGIFALVLVMLLNAISAQASSTGEPSVVVSSYWELVSAVQNADTGDVIGFTGTIIIEPDTEMGSKGKSITLKRMDGEATIVLPEEDGSSTIRWITFDGNSPDAGGTKPLIQVYQNAFFEDCNFIDCFNQEGNGGAIYQGARSLQLDRCTFSGNSAINGSHIYSSSNWSLTINNCAFEDGWADEAGGAIYLAPDSFAYIDSSEVYENHSRVGGGIYNAGYLNVSKTLIYKNECVIQGADIAIESSATYLNDDTEAIYNRLLKNEGLYFLGWVDDINTQFGFSGQCLKFEYTDTDPYATPPDEDSKEDEGAPQEPTDPQEPVEPTNPDEGGSGGEEIEPSEPTEPSEGDNTGGQDNPPTESEGSPTEGDSGSDDGNKGDEEQAGSDETDPPQENPTEPSGDKDTGQESTPKDEGIAEGGEKPTTPTDEPNPSSFSEDKNPVSDGGNSSSVNNTDNSSTSEDHSNKDNHSTYSEDNSYRDSSSTYNYYYDPDSGGAQGVQVIEIPQYVPVEGSGGSQPVSVTVNVPEGKSSYSGSTETTEPSTQAAQAPAQNIKIDAENVDIVYEYTAEGVSISISSSKEAVDSSEPQAVPVAYSPTTLDQEPERAAQSVNWVDIVSMILLAILVLRELRDKLKKTE